MKEEVNDKGRHQKEPHREPIANVHSAIEKSWFSLKLHPAMAAMRINLRELAQIVGRVLEKFALSALRAPTLQYCQHLWLF